MCVHSPVLQRPRSLRRSASSPPASVRGWHMCRKNEREREREREEHEKRESDLTIAAVMCKPGVSSIIFAFAIIAALIAFRAIELTEHGAGTSSHDCWSFFTALTQHVYPEVVEAVAHPEPPHSPHCETQHACLPFESIPFSHSASPPAKRRRRLGEARATVANTKSANAARMATSAYYAFHTCSSC